MFNLELLGMRLAMELLVLVVVCTCNITSRHVSCNNKQNLPVPSLVLVYSVRED